MDFLDIKNAFLIGVFMAFMIGPVFFMLIQTSILKGIRSAIAFDMGVILGDVCFILIAYYGSRSLLEEVKDDPRLFLVGGLILVIYGLVTFFKKDDPAVIKTPKLNPYNYNYLKLLLKGFLLNFINIGVLAGWLGIMVMVAPSVDMNPRVVFWYFTTVMIGYFITDLIKIILAKQLKRKLTPSVIHKIKKGMGIMLIVFGGLLMLQGFIPRKELNKMMNQMTSQRLKPYDDFGDTKVN